MPRDIPADLLAHLRGETTTTALCWRITPRGKAAEGYTDHDEDILFGGVTYNSLGALLPTAIPASIGLDPDSVEIQTLLPGNAGALALPQVTPERLATGYYADAEIALYLVNWRNVGVPSPLLSGHLGTPKMQGLSATFALLPLAEMLARPIGRVTCPTCPYARFGRGHCRNEWGTNDGPRIADRTVTGTVAAATSLHQLMLSGINKPSDWATMGILRFQNGVLAGVESEVKSWNADGTVHLALSLPLMPSTGDAVALEEGCARTWQACLSKGNSANFGGHPFLPGQSKFQQRYKN